MRKFHPESKMMSHGYNPQWSEGSLKSPIFQTSTFVFKTAEDGKAFFELATGKRQMGDKESMGLIYSRMNNPDMEILENRLCLWDEAEDCAVFESGMAAISTSLLEFLSPGDLLLYSNPVYGGTDHFIKSVLPKYGIDAIGFLPGQEQEEIYSILEQSGKADRLAMIFIETPGNPTCDLIDMDACSVIARRYSRNKDQKVLLAVDNTFLGPIWQHPMKHGADLVLYSATKYIGGHSDVIAGACLGSAELIKRVKGLRTYLGNMAGPWTSWLLMRSLETLKVRMEQQARNAYEVADFLANHPKVEKVYYLGNHDAYPPYQYDVFQRQCTSAGAMISFDIEGGEEEAFCFLNNLKLIKLAVSLGSTESLAQHPASMTHAGVDKELKDRLHVTDKLIRLSIGVEHFGDIIWDITQALDQVPAKSEMKEEPGLLIPA